MLSFILISRVPFNLLCVWILFMNLFGNIVFMFKCFLKLVKALGVCDEHIIVHIIVVSFDFRSKPRAAR